MAKPKRVYKSEVDLAPALQGEWVPTKDSNNKEKEALARAKSPRRFDTDLILGIIERIKNL